MTTLYLVRHGQVDNNRLGQLNGGGSDQHLNELGLRQAASLAQPFAEIAPDVIYSSPLHRAVETAKGLCGTMKLPIITEDDLCEIDVGDWEGVPYATLGKQKEWCHWESLVYSAFRCPGSKESVKEVALRMGKAVGRIVRSNQGKKIVIVSHAKALRMLLTCMYDSGVCGAMKYPPVGNACYSEFQISDDGYFCAVELSVRRHLQKDCDGYKIRSYTPEWMKRKHYFAEFDPAADR